MVKIADVFEVGWLKTNGSYEGRTLSKGTSLINPTFDWLINPPFSWWHPNKSVLHFLYQNQFIKEKGRKWTQQRMKKVLSGEGSQRMKKAPSGEGSQLWRFYCWCWLGPTSARFHTCVRIQSRDQALSAGPIETLLWSELSILNLNIWLNCVFCWSQVRISYLAPDCLTINGFLVTEFRLTTFGPPWFPRVFLDVVIASSTAGYIRKVYKQPLREYKFAPLYHGCVQLKPTSQTNHFLLESNFTDFPQCSNGARDKLLFN